MAVLGWATDMCVNNQKGTWSLGPKGLTASPKLADSLTKALSKSWEDKGKVGAKRGGGLKIPGKSGGAGGRGSSSGGSSATAPPVNVAVD